MLAFNPLIYTSLALHESMMTSCDNVRRNINSIVALVVVVVFCLVIKG